MVNLKFFFPTDTITVQQGFTTNLKLPKSPLVSFFDYYNWLAGMDLKTQNYLACAIPNSFLSLSSIT